MSFQALSQVCLYYISYIIPIVSPSSVTGAIPLCKLTFSFLLIPSRISLCQAPSEITEKSAIPQIVALIILQTPICPSSHSSQSLNAASINPLSRNRSPVFLERPGRYHAPQRYSPCPVSTTLTVLKMIFQSTQKLRSWIY